MATKTKTKSKASGRGAAAANLVSSGIPTKWLYNAIIGSLFAILFGSVNHLAATYASIEPKNSLGVVSWIISIGIEAGMIAIAFGIAEKRRRKEGAGMLYFFLSFFAFINFFANVYFAYSIYTDIRNLKMADISKVDSLVTATILILSGSLPVLALTLSELQSLFFVKLKQEEYSLKVQEEKERKKQEREALKIERRQLKEERLMRRASGAPREQKSVAVKPVEIEESESEPEPDNSIEDAVIEKPIIKRRGRPAKESVVAEIAPQLSSKPVLNDLIDYEYEKIEEEAPVRRRPADGISIPLK